jgi:hypothetical protein
VSRAVEGACLSIWPGARGWDLGGSADIDEVLPPLKVQNFHQESAHHSMSEQDGSIEILLLPMLRQSGTTLPQAQSSCLRWWVSSFAALAQLYPRWL